VSSLRARRARSPRRERGAEWRTVVLIRTLLGFESVLYSAVTPMLPHYAHQFAASKTAIGVLAAAYPAGMLPGSLLGGLIATRAGVRPTTVVGLVIFAFSIVAFGFGSDIVALDALRFVQGMACGCVWGGGLAWAIAIAPRGRRGEVLGSVMASAIFGTLVGPVLGTLAVAVGTRPVFACVGAVSLVLTVLTLGHPEPPRASPGTPTHVRALVRDPRAMLGFWLILLEACTIGATGTLLPLRLSRFGASGVAIGLTFVLASLLSTLLTPLIGRLVDRRGSRSPLSAGLVLTAVLLALLPLPQSPLLLAALTVIALGGPLAVSMIPAMSLITDSVERTGVALAFGTMLLNLAWAVGETIGAPAAASISRATSDTVPLLALAAVMLITLSLVRLRRPVAGARGLADQPVSRSSSASVSSSSSAGPR
jgi:MFS family permease